MPIQMTYDGGILSATISAFPVSAYAFSNVDAFGAHVLCWYTGLYSQPSLSALSADLSAHGIYDKGWMAVNSRQLKPRGA